MEKSYKVVYFCKSYLKYNLKAMSIKIFILPCVKKLLGYILAWDIRKALKRTQDYLILEKAFELRGVAYGLRKCS